MRLSYVSSTLAVCGLFAVSQAASLQQEGHTNPETGAVEPPPGNAHPGNLQHTGPPEPPRKVNVHFVPHSHMDAGWNDTYDKMYEERGSVLMKSVF